MKIFYHNDLDGWVDSGLAERTGSEQDIPGLRQTWGAGCELTYAYMYAMSQHATIEQGRKITPKYIQLIGDRDTWTWKYGDETKYFFSGILANELEPSARIWSELDADYNNEIVYRIQAEGRIIERYRSLSNKESLLDTGFEVEFEGYNCYAVNGRYDSKPFEALYPDKDIWLTFRYLGKSQCWMVSLYSDKIDVSEIAKKYEYHGKRGGGHKGAAGFECEYPPFLPRLSAIEYLQETIDNLLARISEPAKEGNGNMVRRELAKEAFQVAHDAFVQALGKPASPAALGHIAGVIYEQLSSVVYLKVPEDYSMETRKLLAEVLNNIGVNYAILPEDIEVFSKPPEKEEEQRSDSYGGNE